MSGFTLIEMIGVLAVLAILAALLIPKIFEAIQNARVNQAAVTVQTVKTGCAEHYAKFGSLPVDGSVTPPSRILLDGTDARAGEFSVVLLRESILDKHFAVLIGSGFVELVPAEPSDTPPDGLNAAYNLDATGSPNDARGTVVAQAVIVGVSLADARALNGLIDGAALGEDTDQNDFNGRVKYAKPGPIITGKGPGNGKGKGKAWAWGLQRDNAANVFIYLNHH